jgi:hypothetical protein
MRQAWFDKFVLPDLRNDGIPEPDIEAARSKALMEFDNGQGGVSSFFNSAGRGVAGLASGVVGGVGAITGSDGLMQTADEMDAAVNNALPVNPSMPKTNFVGGALGQAAGVLGSAFTGGALAKGLAGVRGIAAGPALVAAVETGSEAAAMGSGVMSGFRQGAQDAEQYGMTGGDYAARVLLGGATEYFTDKIPFGLGTETAAAKRLLGAGQRVVGKRGLSFGGGIVTEGIEEGVSQVAQNASNTLLAAPGVETPGLLSDVPSSMAGGAIGGAGFSAVNLATGSRDSLPPPAGFTNPAQPAAPAQPAVAPVAPAAAGAAAGAAAPVVPPAVEAARAIPPGNKVTLNGLPFAYSEADGGWLRPSTPDELLANPTALMRPLDPNDAVEGAVIPQLYAKAEAWHRKQKDIIPDNSPPAEPQPAEVQPVEVPFSLGQEINLPAVRIRDGRRYNTTEIATVTDIKDNGVIIITYQDGGGKKYIYQDGIEKFRNDIASAAALAASVKDSSAVSAPGIPTIPTPAPTPETAALEAAFRSAQANPTPVSIDTPDGNTVEVTPESLVAAFRRATGQPEAANEPAPIETTDPTILNPAQELEQPPVEGRAQPLTAPVFTPSGPVAIGSLLPGDSILASDGTSQQVTGVFPQGVKPVFNLHLADGPTVPATADHLWFARRWNEEPEVVTTARLIEGIEAGELWEIPMLEAS